MKVSPLGVVDISEERIAELKEKIGGLEDLKKQLRELKTTEALDLIIAGALKISASDIHLEPEEAIIRVRYRLDGILSNIGDLPTREYARILSRIKIISGLKINIHNTPQDGRFTIRLDSRDVEVRVSILPGAFGENVVMRILDPLTTTQKLSSLGMRPDLLAILEAELKKTSGAILTTGPTGSGKTTSLYSFVRYLNREGIKIITIEDPIEYQITGISQTQVDEHQGYTFASGLRSIVRQDPDVILVGEIRDGETAEIAIQAGLTGHLVFSTLHTNDAAGTIPRLIDLGARPVNIGPALNVAMAQRLVRKLCSCKEETPLPALETEKIKKAFEQLSPAVQLPVISPEITIFKAKGCPKCNQGGYVGRIGIFELFLVSTDMERLITTSPSIPQVRDLALKEGMVPMLQDGYLKVLEGATTLEEIYRVVS
ncbi:MAG: hypothetical protein COV31_01620 [Candidatus Yanofskybacteria bacterium CG10_big_fil_rev_8_21_14_0_10_46_23]|uniref:Bacterial type II secretion system protein E domain-containing protein n=1 Tax=Candidatus Yanofskybacteria bacterium CG10_big_fil_rev_8_21_14_0_10_46_23 TaxID=1975098 RepID=A0A2H0R4Y3_9BACT|nr:MAG: hypothetical protein COV31_01620 [Candidatus Yanofskybacteria bacterium CG10_big_fil_rev_8_21_14_0_10_46_23]